MSNNQQEDPKVVSRLFATQSKFDLQEAEKIAKIMGWRYWNSKGAHATAEEISACLSACVNNAATQYLKNVEELNPFKFISSSTGRVTVRIDFFNQNSPGVEITFGMIYWG